MTEDSLPPDSTPEDPQETPKPLPRRRLAPLPFGARLLVLVVGGLLVVVGFAGLLLPGIQGILTIVLGAAILSLASDWVYKLQVRILGRWPSISARLERFRHGAHGWLSRDKTQGHDGGAGGDDET